VLCDSETLFAIPYVTPDDADWPKEAVLAFPGGAYKIEISRKSGCTVDGVQMKHAARQEFWAAIPAL
jgi:hypothetical protein